MAPRVRQEPLSRLKANPANPRTITQSRLDQLKHSLEADPEMLHARPCIALPDGTVIAGNQRLQAASELGWKTIPTITVDLDEARAAQWLFRDNQEYGEWDDAALAMMLEDLQALDSDLVLTGFPDDEVQRLLDSLTPDSGLAGMSPLSDAFILPPLTVLDARSGAWSARRDEWRRAGLDDRQGRSDSLLFTGGTGAVTPRLQAYSGGTSLFDPVLAELLVRWLSAPGMSILDPMSGGPTRGIVSTVLGRTYTGIDLRSEQVEANHAEAARLLTSSPLPTWIEGDGQDVARLVDAPVDMILTCPPYGSLERYSDDPRDLSQMPLDTFTETLHRIITESCSLLRPDRFAAIVVSEYRSHDGTYTNFIGHTIDAFTSAGLAYYNDAVLVSPVGTTGLTVRRQFNASRKLGKTHQNVLIFAKGDPTAATTACGSVDTASLPDEG